MIHSVMPLHCSKVSSLLRIAPNDDCVLPNELAKQRMDFELLFQAGDCRPHEDDAVWTAEAYIEDHSIRRQSLRTSPTGKVSLRLCFILRDAPLSFSERVTRLLVFANMKFHNQLLHYGVQHSRLCLSGQRIYLSPHAAAWLKHRNNCANGKPGSNCARTAQQTALVVDSQGHGSSSTFELSATFCQSDWYVTAAQRKPLWQLHVE
jgi:hypothetical protein